MATSFEKTDLEWYVNTRETTMTWDYCRVIGTDFKLKQLSAFHSTQISQ